jgi:biopolymer transport protein ExbD
MSRRKARPAAEEGAIDLTPMLDVVFIMLIFFIVTASFIKEAGIDVNRPDAITSQKKPKAAILIAVDPSSAVWIEGNKIDVRLLKNKITQMRADNPEGSVVIQADEEATADVIIDVMDAARAAGVFDVALSTEQ